MSKEFRPKFKLTFASTKECVRKGNKTIASVKSYLRQESFDFIFRRFGFQSIPEPVINILKQKGYRFDYETKSWAIVTQGVVVLQDGDEDNQTKACNIAYTKAKAKAMRKAVLAFSEINDLFISMWRVSEDSYNKMVEIFENECEAYTRCIETGYCDPNKQ